MFVDQSSLYHHELSSHRFFFFFFLFEWQRSRWSYVTTCGSSLFVLRFVINHTWVELRRCCCCHVIVRHTSDVSFISFTSVFIPLFEYQHMIQALFLLFVIRYSTRYQWNFKWSLIQPIAINTYFCYLFVVSLLMRSVQQYRLDWVVEQLKVLFWTMTMTMTMMKKTHQNRINKQATTRKHIKPHLVEIFSQYTRTYNT